MSQVRKRVLGRLSQLLLGQLLEDVLSTAGMGNGRFDSLLNLDAQALDLDRVSIEVPVSTEDAVALLAMPATLDELEAEAAAFGWTQGQIDERLPIVLQRLTRAGAVTRADGDSGTFRLTFLGEALQEAVAGNVAEAEGFL